jgi:hypothetical protein
MATTEQKAASLKVMEAVTALNRALETASMARLFVELETTNEIGARNPQYFVAKIETRETVLP